MEHPGRLSGYASDIFRYVALAACSIGCWWMVTGGTWTGWGAYAGTWASAVALGLYWHVVALLCHDIVSWISSRLFSFLFTEVVLILHCVTSFI